MLIADLAAATLEAAVSDRNDGCGRERRQSWEWRQRRRRQWRCGRRAGRSDDGGCSL